MTAVDRGEQLAWERRLASPVAAAALVGAALTLASLFLPGLLTAPPPGAAAGLLAVLEQPTAYVAVLAGQTLPALLLVPVLFYLYRATKARTSRLPAAALVLAVLGPIIFAGAGVANGITLVDVAERYADTPSGRAAPVAPAPKFSDGGGRLEKGALEQALAQGALAADGDDVAADLLRSDSARQVVAGFQQGAALAIAFALIMINLSAMRAGLVSRFLGIIGVLVGVFYVLPLVNVSILQAFWLGAVGLIVLDRWPNGRGPAWETGEERPWPTAAQQREAYEQRTAERREQLDSGERAPDSADASEAKGGAAPRKRKQRS